MLASGRRRPAPVQSESHPIRSVLHGPERSASSRTGPTAVSRTGRQPPSGDPSTEPKKEPP